MLDTLRLVGPADYYRFNYDYERFLGYKTKEGEERISQVLVENKKGVHRVFYTPSTETIVVELNPAKLMFKSNVWNYESNTNVLNAFVRSVGGSYFRSSSYYIARCDIGGIHSFENTAMATQAIEKYRATRIPGARAERFRQQNYKHSVFYSSKNWSVKIYNKGYEMKLSDAPELAHARYEPGFDLLSTLRFEKTYRFRELERIGMNVEAYKGVHIDEFDISLPIRDFYNVFQNWEFTTTPYITEKKGSKGLLSVIDQYGGLSEIEGQNIVSRSTIWRYRKEKQKQSDFTPKVTFENNLTQNVAKYWYYYRTLGINSLLTV